MPIPNIFVRFSPLIVFSFAIGLVWTLFLMGIFTWNQSMKHEQTLAVATTQTRALFQKFLLTRLWNASHGGVYVPVTKDTGTRLSGISRPELKRNSLMASARIARKISTLKYTRK